MIKDWKLDGADKKNKTMPNAYLLQEFIASHPARDSSNVPLKIDIVSIENKGTYAKITLDEAPKDLIPEYKKVLKRLDLLTTTEFKFQTYLMKTGMKDSIGYVSWGYTVVASQDNVAVSLIDTPKWHEGKDPGVWGK